MSRLRYRLLLIVAAVAFLLAGAGGFFTYQVQQVPEFYEQAIAERPAEQAAAGQQFEQQALEVQNQIRRAGASPGVPGEWRAEISAAEVNGWLATVLPEKFPGVLPPEVSDPRVAIDQDRLRLAAKYRASGWDAIVSLELSAFLTAEPNVIAVRVHRVAAGNVPVPVAQYLEGITAAAAKRNIFIRWQEVEGDPLAIVTLPIAEPGDKREIIVRSLELQPGKAIITGTAEEVEIKPTKRVAHEAPLPQQWAQ